ncbi:MAG: glycosyltransferase family 4 protein [Hyphomicrobiaceae bacterium]
MRLPLPNGSVSTRARSRHSIEQYHRSPVTGISEKNRVNFMRTVNPGELQILFLAKLPPPIHGATVVSGQVFDALKSLDYVHLTHMWDGSASTLQEIGKKDLRRIVGFVRLVARLTGRIFSRIRYDVAYLTFTPWAHTAIRDAILIFISRIIATRTLVHLHTAGLEKVLQPTTLRDRVIRRLITGAELITITTETAQMARASGVFNDVHTLANTASDPGVPAIVAKTSMTCGCLSNLDRRKGVLQFVDAIAALRHAGLPVEGRIAGAPTSDLSVADVKAYVAESGLDGCVDVLGQLSGESKTEFLSNLDLFIYLSRHDLAPLVLIEALSHAAAPIVFDTGGIREMVGAHFADSVLSPDSSADVFRERILEIVQRYADDPSLLVSDKKAARARYLESFAEPIFRVHLEEIFIGPLSGGLDKNIDVFAEPSRHASI